VNTAVFDSAAVKHKLPLYIQNMFLACGYDTLDVIAELNVMIILNVILPMQTTLQVQKTQESDQMFGKIWMLCINNHAQSSSSERSFIR